MCLPSTCTSQDAVVRRSSDQRCFYLLSTIRVYGCRHYWNVRQILLIFIIGIVDRPTVYVVFRVVLSLLGCLVIAGTVYDIYLDHKDSETEENACIMEETKMKENPSGKFEYIP